MAEENQNIEQPKKKSRKWLWILLGIFLFLVLISLGREKKEEIGPGQISQEGQKVSIDEIKNTALKGLNYDELLRNNEKYVGKIVYYRGEIVQVTEEWKDNYILRVYVTEKEYIWDDDIWANYKGERVLENDIIDIWGKVKGIKKYTTVLGASRSIPEIDVLNLEVVKKTGGEISEDKEKVTEKRKIETKIFNLGDEVQLGDRIIIVYSVNDYQEPNEFLQPKTGNKYITVDVSLENTGTEPIEYYSSDFKLQDAKGYTYPEGTTTKEPKFGYYGALQPGRKIRGFIVYEVSTIALGFELIYTPSREVIEQAIIKLSK